MLLIFTPVFENMRHVKKTSDMYKFLIATMASLNVQNICVHAFLLGNGFNYPHLSPLRNDTKCKYGLTLSKMISARQGLTTAQIAKFIGPTWGPSWANGTQMGPMWSHEPCYQDNVVKCLAIVSASDDMFSVTLQQQTYWDIWITINIWEIRLKSSRSRAAIPGQRLRSKQLGARW